MINIIKKIELLADKNITIDPIKTTTLITGFSGKGKTLLFKLIKYVLGENRSINIEEAKKQFSGLDSIRITFSNGYVFWRKLNSKFDGKIKLNNNSDFIPLDEKRYKNYVGELFGHANIKVLKKGNPPTAVSFTISEYLNTLFFDETRLTDDKTLIDVESYAGKLKLKNYYKYFLTGEIIDQQIIKEAKTEQQSAQLIGQAFKYLSKSVPKPSQETLNKKANIQKRIHKNETKLKDIAEHILSLDEEERSLSINKNRLLSLYDLYSSQLSEVKTASMLDDYMKDATIICNNCGEKIKWEPIIDPEKQMIELANLLADLTKTLGEIEHILRINKNKREKLKANAHELEIENSQLLERLNQIEKMVHDYLAVENCRKVALSKPSEKSSSIQLNEQQLALDRLFNEQVIQLCEHISARLIKWGFEYKRTVSFDFDKFDFKFDGTLRTLLPKGYKAFYTVAVIIELMLHMKNIKVPCFDFILIDTVWKVASFEHENIITIVSNFINDISNCGLQIIIFENDDIKIKSSNFKHIILE